MRPIHACHAGPGETKAVTNRVAIAEEQLDEFLIDDGDGRRMHGVLRHEAATHHDTRADGVEVLRSGFHP